ncbi:hypothetical protein CEUSTIGMA_g1842.t1 [Chlamydomonas eustigma]|uniref:Uncharacterized protein n=1 Tax=Chlamydomonas eustigma TaxID=1157962 RepID=A0A250WU97_9CHLO|nr:hypothetical protein CEUSTIGMA_g1842.t1 [Chlamydomonas eustigma]|eukprot:GAX74394.1 hypothetical protein CEUSTIGMA_g1842.t1 [Chlamydomonas eustigma]
MPQVTVVRGGDDGENSAYFQLIDGKLHLPTIGSFFGLVPSSMRLDGTVHASDGSGLTFLTFQDGQTITVVGEPAQTTLNSRADPPTTVTAGSSSMNKPSLPLSVQSVPPPCRVLLVYTLQTTSKRGPNILDTSIPISSYEHQGEASLRQHGRRDNHDHVPGRGDAHVAEADEGFDEGFNNKRRKLQAAEDEEEELLGTWTLPSNHTTAAFGDLEHQVQGLMIGNAVLVKNCQFMYRYYGSTLPIRSTAALQEAISHFRSLMSCTMAVDDLMQQCRIYVSPKPATSRSASQLCLSESSVISLTPSSSPADILNPAAAPPPPLLAAMKAAPSAGEAVAALSQSQQQAAVDHTSLPVLLPVLMEVKKEALQTQLAGSANTQQGGTAALNAGAAELVASVLSAAAALTPNPDDINPVTPSVIVPASFSAATSSALSFSAVTLNQMMALSSAFSSSTQPAIMKIIPEIPAAIPTVKPGQSLLNEPQLVSSDAQLLHLKGSSIDIADESGSSIDGALSGLATAAEGQAADGASSFVAPHLQPLFQDYLSGAMLPAMNSSGSISLPPFQNIPISQLRQPSIPSGTTTADITAAAAGATDNAAAPGTSDKVPVVPAAAAAPGTSDNVPVVPAAAAAAQQILNILPFSVVDAAAVLSSSGSVSVPSGLLLQLISNYQLTQQQQQQQQPPVAANAANIRDGEASSAAAAMTLNNRQSSTPLLQQVHQVGRPGSAAAAAATPASPAAAAADVPAEWSLIQASVSKQPYHHAALPPQQSQRGGEFIRQQHFMSAAAAAAAGGVLGSNYSRQNEGEDLQEGIDHYADEGGLDMYGGQAGEAGDLMTKGKSKESKTRYADGRFKDEERHLKKMEEMHLRCSELFEGRITHLITVLDHKSLRCEACPDGGSLIKAYSAYHIDAVRKHFLRHHESLLKQGGVCPDNYRKEYEMPAKMRRAVATTTRSSSSPMMSTQPPLHPSGGNQTAASGFGSAAPSPAAPQFLLDKLYLTSYASMNQPLGYQQPSDHLGSAFHGNAMRSSDHDHDGKPDGPSYFHHQHTEHQQRRLPAPAEPKKRQVAAAAAAGHALQQEILDQMYLTSYASRGTSTKTAAEAAPGAHPEAVRRYSGSSYALSGSEPMAAAVPARVSNAGNPSLFDQLYEYACDPLTPASALHQPLPEVPMSAVQSVPEHFGTHYEPQQQQHRETYGTEHLFDLVDAMAQLPPDPLRDRLVNDLYFDSYAAAGAASAAAPASTPSSALTQSTHAAMTSSSAPRSSSSQLINDIYFKSYAAGHLAGLEAAAGTHTAAGSGRLPAAAAAAAGCRATQSVGPLSVGLRAYPGHAAPLSVTTSSNRHLSQLHSNYSSSWAPDPPSFHPSSVIRAAADALGAAKASSSRTGPATGGAGDSSASDAALVLHPTDEVIISEGPANHDARAHASASEAPEQWGRLLDVAAHDVSAEDAALMESLGI